MNSRSARAQIEGECFDKEVIFKSPEPTTRVLSRGGVIEYRAYKYPNKTSTEHGTQATTNCTSWRSDGSPSCLGGSSHRWVPGHHTHSTPVPLRRESVGGSAQTHNTRQRQTMCPDLYPLRPVYAIAGKHNRIIIGRGVARAVQHVVPAPGGSLPPQRRRTMNMFHRQQSSAVVRNENKIWSTMRFGQGF